jgi:hypothetical protein
VGAHLVPVPIEWDGQPSSACKFDLAGLANHAGPDGTGAFPSVATLVRYTNLAERTVRTCMDRLGAAGIILPCDPGHRRGTDQRADRRPKGWDLDLIQVRDHLGDVDEGEEPLAGAGVQVVHRCQYRLLVQLHQLRMA